MTSMTNMTSSMTSMTRTWSSMTRYRTRSSMTS